MINPRFLKGFFKTLQYFYDAFKIFLLRFLSILINYT